MTIPINPLKGKSPYGWHFEQNVYDLNGITRSVKAGGGSGNIPKVILGGNMNLRIRKLTPKECWRLMGFDDEDVDKASQVNSNTQLYKQAGNSIVVNVLEAILINLLLNNEQTTNPDVIEGQTTIYDFIEPEECANLTKEEIQRLLFCADLVIQNFGENEELERIYEKLLKIKEVAI